LTGTQQVLVQDEPQEWMMKEGDVMEATIEGIGTFTSNTVKRNLILKATQTSRNSKNFKNFLNLCYNEIQI
jgi:hypothetical protein